MAPVALHTSNAAPTMQTSLIASSKSVQRHTRARKKVRFSGP
jgi:hypothetical protein